MRVVLDACVPRPLYKLFVGYPDVVTTARLRLNRLDDGDLLDALAGKCDVFITVDKSIPWQQRLDHRPFALVLLRATSNRLETLVPLMPEVLKVLPGLVPGEVRVIELV
jgi:hypothetical protein